MKHVSPISLARPALAQGSGTIPITSLFWQWFVWILDAAMFVWTGILRKS